MTPTDRELLERTIERRAPLNTWKRIHGKNWRFVRLRAYLRFRRNEAGRVKTDSRAFWHDVPRTIAQRKRLRNPFVVRGMRREIRRAITRAAGATVTDKGE